MNKKYKYYPNYKYDSGSALREFAAAMPTLEIVHGHPVRMVETRRRFGIITIIYELIKETTNDK